jgi:hypothetical protein
MVVNGLSDSQQLLDMIRKNQIILEDTNKELMNQLDECRRRDQEQQLTWEGEVNELAGIIQSLKDQLNQAHEKDFQ